MACERAQAGDSLLRSRMTSHERVSFFASTVLVRRAERSVIAGPSARPSTPHARPVHPSAAGLNAVSREMPRGKRDIQICELKMSELANLKERLPGRPPCGLGVTCLGNETCRGQLVRLWILERYTACSKGIYVSGNPALHQERLELNEGAGDRRNAMQKVRTSRIQSWDVKGTQRLIIA